MSLCQRLFWHSNLAGLPSDVLVSDTQLISSRIPLRFEFRHSGQMVLL